MLTITNDQYIFPPRSQDAIPRESTEFLKDYDWLAQFKYNDSRTVIKYCANGDVELWNRHAEQFRTYTLTKELQNELHELQEILGLSTSEVSMIDGGLLDQKHHAIKNTIVIWDILVRDGQHLLGTKYLNRYDSLRDKATNDPWMYESQLWAGSPQHEPINFGCKYTQSIFIPDNWHPSQWPTAWDIVNKANKPFTHGKPTDQDYTIKPILEGLVFKDPDGKLEMGFREKNNDTWMMRSRVPTGRHLF